ncbi:hypothetical protein KP509_11G050200 [Ceratopteris richardii]|nr:hypothetical protein KP509_11G050200 [Ceratopteris richardii]
MDNQPFQKMSDYVDIDPPCTTRQQLHCDGNRRFNKHDEEEVSSQEHSSSVCFDPSTRSEWNLSMISHLRHVKGQAHSSSFSVGTVSQQDYLSGECSEEVSSASLRDGNESELVSFPSVTRMDGKKNDASRSFPVTRKEANLECTGLVHAHKLGLSGTNLRLRCLINWLVGSMLRLHHPGSSNSQPLVHIYGPRVDYDRGASVAFNLTDWKGNILQPLLVQRLADRSNISVGVKTLKHIHVTKSSAIWPAYIKHLNSSNINRECAGSESRLGGKSSCFDVLTATICFLSNFEDVYRFWLFLANFLDADFISKEVWRYKSLNQEAIVLGAAEYMNP